MIQYFQNAILNLENQMMFQLKGLTGNETAKITISGNETQTLNIGQQWRAYSFPIPKRRSFMFTIAVAPKQRVEFQPANSYKIRGSHSWKAWNCGREGENERCDLVRGGILAWSGSYKLFYMNPGML